MTIKEELMEYCYNCLKDKYVSIDEDYISCLKHKQACKRLLEDFENEESCSNYPYFWDEEEAQKIVKWYMYLKHSKGVLANREIELTVSQKFTICQLYGWRRKENGRKRFTKMFKEEARKNARIWRVR